MSSSETSVTSDFMRVMKVYLKLYCIMFYVYDISGFQRCFYIQVLVSGMFGSLVQERGYTLIFIPWLSTTKQNQGLWEIAIKSRLEMEWKICSVCSFQQEN